MNAKNTTLLSVLTLSVLANVGLGIAHFRRQATPAVPVPETAASSAAETNATPAAVGVVTTNAVEKTELKVVKFIYRGDDEIRLRLSHAPDMANIRRYVSVSPLASGYVSIDSSMEYVWDGGCRRIPTLVIRGDFAHRTNVTVCVRHGLAPAGKGATASADEVLQEDFIETFRRRDLRPSVDFASRGRYLPPCGPRAIALTSVNCASVRAEIRRVEPRNLVQLLAREEDMYKRYYGGGGDSEDTIELSGEPTVRVLKSPNRPNVKERLTLSMGVEGTGPTNGVYHVALANGDSDTRDYRLVCVSDLALSVRRCGKDGCGVWVTSLTTGRPVADAWVEVYSVQGIRVMDGRTDAQGWCAASRVAAGEPFAVVVLSPEADDMTFLALSDRMTVDETHPDGARLNYLKPTEAAGFAWTERGIYRHGEKIFLQVILRDGTMKAPAPFPVRLELVDPEGDVYASTQAMSTDLGTVTYDRFVVPDDQPSGRWTLRARLPGKNGGVLAATTVKIEEFALPQVRVTVAPAAGTGVTNFAFDVSGEYLFGGAAQSLRVEGAIVYEDAPFQPAGWTDYRFGNEDNGLKPNFTRFDGGLLDEHGYAQLVAPLWTETPKAMVRAIAQGVVFEDGGRPATARGQALLHPTSFYIGTTLKEWMGRGTVKVACVGTDGKRLGVAKTLKATIERFESVYSYQEREEGWTSWNANRLRVTLAENLKIEVPADGVADFALPLTASGDYFLTIVDPETGVSFGRAFYLSDSDDEGTVATPLGNPTQVTIKSDKPFYRVGETPRLVVKSPFAGAAMLTVLRDKEVYTEILNLTNATSEVTLRAVRAEDAPNLDVYLSVVQAVTTKNHLAVRAHGQTTVVVRPAEQEIVVGVAAEVQAREDGGLRLEVAVTAPRREGTPGTLATITVVDEGINLLTGERTPDPIGALGAVRTAEHPLFDLYGRLLPVLEDGLKASGVKTGGGFGAELLSRVSPVGSRRFKPLVRWQAEVPVVDGRAAATFDLPEFAGELRVTAVVVSDRATGAASIQKKVTPKVVMLPDAPRFVAPDDVFYAKLPLFNKHETAGEIRYVIGSVTGAVTLAANASTNLSVRLTAPAAPGEMVVGFRAEGFGETHMDEIRLPVRPAVGWVETNGWERREEGEGGLVSATRRGAAGTSAGCDSGTSAGCDSGTSAGGDSGTSAITTPRREGTPGTPDVRYCEKVYDSPLGAYEAALRWLGDYPHGCLEQTSSRIFPLIAAGGILNTVVTNGADVAVAGVRRVESMVRENDFVMWPDCTYAPWTREVSLYAAHFLFAAERAGIALDPSTRGRVVRFLKKWVLEKDSDIAAYAALVATLAGSTDRDRLFTLYDDRAKLSALARSRLALAFATLGDSPRATALLADVYDPQSVKEVAFRVLALVAVDPQDKRVLPLVGWLNASRDKARLSWGTTEENAHALLAIGAYFQAVPPQKGETFVAWRKLTLPKPEEVRAEADGLFIDQRYLDAKGNPADLAQLRCGQLLFAELTVTSAVTRVVNDLVIQDLFPAAFEPVHGEVELGDAAAEGGRGYVKDWVMRSDARDDRMLVFSKQFTLEAGDAARFVYPVRVVSAGDFVLPGASVEGMYDPCLHARRAPGRLVVRP